MKRVIDEPFFTYSAYIAMTTAGIYVKCPSCKGLGIVTADKSNAYFKCTNCGSSKEMSRTTYRYDVHNQCKICGRYYRVDIIDKTKQHFRTLHVACPTCGYVMSGAVHRSEIGTGYYVKIENACAPYFGFELWFLTHFDSKTVWAINREHLAYLIDYLSADLREKPIGYQMGKTQAHALPTFMKTAKNRDKIVKLLRDMQKKQY